MMRARRVVGIPTRTYKPETEVQVWWAKAYVGYSPTEFMSTPTDLMGSLARIVRVSVRVILIFFVVVLIHEGAHALMFAYFGYPVTQFVVGVGDPWVSVVVGPTEFGLTPFLLGAYVRAPEGVPRIPSVLAILAGPLANLGFLLLHPWSPLRYVHEVVRDTPSLGFRKALGQMLRRIATRINPDVKVPITLPDGKTITLSGSKWDVERAAKQIKKDRGIIDPPKNPFTDESYLDHIPFIGFFRFIRDSSIWMVSFAIGFMNLIPIPPMDGAHFIYAAIDTQSSTVDSAYTTMVYIGLGLLLVVQPLYGMARLFRQRRQFAQEHPALVPQ